MTKEELKFILREVKKWRARATTLLTLYIPPGRPIADVVRMLRQEYSVTENIKLKRTRDKVQTAIAMAIDRLIKIPKVPKNGLVLFIGVHDETNDTIDLVFSPPEPVKVFFYRTDKWFHTEFLDEMVEARDTYGLIIIERDEATVGLLKGNRVYVLDEIEGYVPSKHSRGGWSQRRYDRIIEELTKDFYKRVGEKANAEFLPLLQNGQLKGIIIGGPGFSKLDFLKGDYLDYRLKKLVLPKTIDVSDQGEPGLRQMVMKAEDMIKEHSFIKLRKAIEEFTYHLAKDDGLAIYGEDEVKEAIRLGAVKFIIITEDHPEAEEIVREAEKRSTEIFIIDSEVPEYSWIKNTFGGVVAVLRYRIY